MAIALMPPRTALAPGDGFAGGWFSQVSPQRFVPLAAELPAGRLPRFLLPSSCVATAPSRGRLPEGYPADLFAVPRSLPCSSSGSTRIAPSRQRVSPLGAVVKPPRWPVWMSHFFAAYFLHRAGGAIRCRLRVRVPGKSRAVLLDRLDDSLPLLGIIEQTPSTRAERARAALRAGHRRLVSSTFGCPLLLERGKVDLGVCITASGRRRSPSRHRADVEQSAAAMAVLEGVVLADDQVGTSGVSRTCECPGSEGFCCRFRPIFVGRSS